MGNAAQVEQQSVATFDDELAWRFARSAAVTATPLCSAEGFRDWFAACRRADQLAVERIPFADLVGWQFDDDGNLRHDSGRFFTIEGLDVHTDFGFVEHWQQPIINQPEIGVLGIVVKEFDGVLHFLMQAKAEPGNIGGVQLSPTVQATRSNYLRVHQGRGVPYLEHFLDAKPEAVLVDVLQSEQGAWFLRKRNRNIVVEATGPVETLPGFCWLTLGVLRELLRQDNTVNMDARTVLSCVPWRISPAQAAAGDEFTRALARGLDPGAAARHGAAEILHWLTDLKARHELRQRLIPLAAVAGWQRGADEIAHADGKYFRVIAARVSAGQREVDSWTQPLLAPVGQGVAVFLATAIDGVLHLLVNAKLEAGVLDVAELAPSVQCQPANHEDLPVPRQPAFLRDVLDDGLGTVRYSGLQSEEGGRFQHADNLYQIRLLPADFPIAEPPGFRWMTPAQITNLLIHSNYANVQARSLMACLLASW
ncbi:NDP-hexose 2,3-dehydratase family protein [Nocardia brasiliensis]|uniref:NDP-hexose 2,3-dehydratase n=1 Tax=Nocardia brasiliensis (strain ATCC 700358 / HUJEG-1) TaxID=1133849 RepID=K0F017_NOCB7|nr:NDP-hexose 2,3-dehydratase family protein [Nocardia brasiliensis]AFU01011.1 NDP-hexose 2,3-dehydratase [Nocardia brasiliensis ATCC 700358]OCF84225.1 NDP-hexose 2,3-dehydratase [Nocardia brasiliensis]